MDFLIDPYALIPRLPKDPYWDDCILLCPYDSSTADFSQYAHPATAYNQAAVSTADSKYGIGSLITDGVGDRVGYGSNNIFDFGTGDFTVEFWTKSVAGALSNGPYIVSRRGSGQGWYVAYTADFGNIVFGRNGAVNDTLNVGMGVPSDDVWTHVALVRASGVLKGYRQGVQSASSFTDTTDYTGILNEIVVGSDYNGTNSFNGRIDDVRISRRARYTAAFTPPTRAHPIGAA